MKLKILLSGLALAANLTYASDFKVGYVDVSKVFTDSKPAEALKTNLAAKLAPQTKELNKLRDIILKEVALMDEIKKKNLPLDKLSSSDKASLKKFQEDRSTFQQKNMLLGQYSKQLQDYASALLLGKANPILQDISEKGNYDIVLISGSPNSNIAYIKPKYNLTDVFITQLNTIDPKTLIKQLDDGIAKASEKPQSLAPKG